MLLFPFCPSVVLPLFSHSFQDPFDDYKKRLAKRLEEKAKDPSQKGAKDKNAKGDDTVNWFGEKIGAAKTTPMSGPGASNGSGVGKYLNVNAKRPASGLSAVDNVQPGTKKPKQMGFGNFDAW